MGKQAFITQGMNIMDMKLLQKLEDYVENYYRYSETYIAESKKTKYSRSKPSTEESPVYQEEISLPGILKKQLDKILARLEDTFSQRVLKIIKKKGFSDVDIYKKANLNRKIFSKLRSDRKYQPSRNTALALIIALELDEYEAGDLLGRAGFALSNGNKEDVIVNFFINNQIYDINLVNEALNYYGLPILGERKSQNVASETTKEDN